MPCDNRQTQEQIEQAMKELEAGLRAKKIKAMKDRTGNVTFQGWTQASRRGCCDACTYRRLTARRSRALADALKETQTLTAKR